jgi:hypothetical protein
MRSFAIVLAAAATNAVVAQGAIAQGATAEGRIRLAQTSTVTNCMMTCNAQAANCRTGCVVPGTPPTASATTTSNATAGTTCLLTCTSTQITDFADAGDCAVLHASAVLARNSE